MHSMVNSSQGMEKQLDGALQVYKGHSYKINVLVVSYHQRAL